MKFEFKTEPFKHQQKALELSAMKKNFAYFMEMGCVDGETEFLTNRGWMKFKDFDINKIERPFLVAQIEPTDIKDYFNLTFVPPISFIKKKTPRFAHFTSTYKFDIMVTEEHDNVVRLIERTSDGEVMSFNNMMATKEVASHVYRYQQKKKDRDVAVSCMAIPASGGEVAGYNVKPSALSMLSEWEMRLLVAIIADGTFPNKGDDKCILEFKKGRKKDRFEMLCTKAGIPYVKEEKKDCKTKYHIIAPYRTKKFGSEFYSLPRTHFETIFDEVPFWDGSVCPNGYRTPNEVTRFYSSDKDSADFVQFLAAIHGFYASVRADLVNRRGDKRVPWVVTWSHNANIRNNYGKSKRSEETNISWENLNDFEIIEGEQDAYCWRVPSGMLFLRRNNKTFITGNSGKTKVMIDNMAYLHQNKHITGAIILAPKGVYRNWAEKEIPTHLLDSIDRDVLVWKAEGSAKYKRDLMDSIKNFDTANGGVQVLVYNVESLISDAGQKAIKAFFAKHGDKVMGIIDESTCIKNHKAKRTKAAVAVGQQCKVRRIATGSPITNSPLDLYSQCAFLDKGLLGCGSFYAFRSLYAQVERMQTRMGTSYDKIVAYKNLDMLSKRIEPFSFRVTKNECLDLPDKIYMTRDVTLTPEQISTYMEMYNREVSFFQGEMMTAEIALTKMLRLHQILCGCFTTDDGTVMSLPNNRISELLETIEETSGKIIIWANYIQNIRDIEEALKKEYGDNSVVTYYGGTSADDRSRAIVEFQNPTSPVRFFVSNPTVGGRGITLTEAHTVIYYSNNFSLETRQQSEDRAHRIGQKNNVTYIDLVVRKTMDEKVIQALLNKRNIANEILKDDLEDWISL